MFINNSEKEDLKSDSDITKEEVEISEPVVPSSFVEDDVKLPKPQVPYLDQSDCSIGYKSPNYDDKKKNAGKIRWGVLSSAVVIAVLGVGFHLTSLKLENENLRGANARLTDSLEKNDKALDILLEEYGRVYNMLEEQTTPKSYVDRSVTYEDGCKEVHLHSVGYTMSEVEPSEEHSHDKPVCLEYTLENGDKEIYELNSETGEYALTSIEHVEEDKNVDENKEVGPILTLQNRG